MGLTMLFSLILVNTYLEFRRKLNKINLFHPLFALGDMIRSLWGSTFGCFDWTHWIPGSQIYGFLDHNSLDCWITMVFFLTQCTDINTDLKDHISLVIRLSFRSGWTLSCVGSACWSARLYGTLIYQQDSYMSS